jgi:beta-phosphoglucomutase-like phosphatase (HAD superfamily)
MPIDAVIFDCDGTLVDSLLLSAEVLIEQLADLGIALSASDVAARFGDGRLATALAQFGERVRVVQCLDDVRRALTGAT